ncbi:MAG: NAD(+) diphosphatase [Pseudomonadota bacterium]
MGVDMPLATTSLNRAAHRRKDDAWLDAAFQADNALIFLMRAGEPLLAKSASPRTPSSLLWLGPEASDISRGAERLFLGQDKAGAPIFALDVPPAFELDASQIAGLGDFEDMRAAASLAPAFDVNAASTARSIFEWHRRHGFCSNCGAPSEIREAGWKRICPSCEGEHFPRTDPVAIMLAVDGDKCLLGRQRGWPAGFFSCLAGFVEPGETVEQAAARELEEEAGITADPDTAEYLFCQPWPFPSSLMIGLILQATSTDITVDGEELDVARWFSRDEIRQILSGDHGDVFAPPPIAVAHHIIKVWSGR